MTGYKMPIFSSGGLLTREMMDWMKNYELAFSLSSFAGYTDGIISGFAIETEPGLVRVGRGMMKYEDTIIFLPDECIVKITPKRETQVVRIVLNDMECNHEFEELQMEITVDTDMTQKRNSIEICRFQLESGARLRTEYAGFEDMNTLHNVVNLIEATWSAYEEDSIHPRILQEFAREAQSCQQKTPADLAFLMQITNLHGRACDRSLIQFYLQEKEIENPTAKDPGDTKRYSNKDIFVQLNRILKNMKHAPVQPVRRLPERRRIII